MEKAKLIELFKMQNVLRDHIGYEGEEKKDKMLLALLVEIGECANEWRGFKYWSTDQEARVKICEECGGDKIKGAYDDEDCFCENAKNPLLEEYVDGLHFVLDYGLEVGIDPEKVTIRKYRIDETITHAFLVVNELAMAMRYAKKGYDTALSYQLLISHYFHLGEMLGFNDDEIFNAYVEKNKVNHQRQDNGY